MTDTETLSRIKEVALDLLREKADWYKGHYNYLEDEEHGGLKLNEDHAKSLSQSFNELKRRIEDNRKERAELQAHVIDYREKSEFS